MTKKRESDYDVSVDMIFIIIGSRIISDVPSGRSSFTIVVMLGFKGVIISREASKIDTGGHVARIENHTGVVAQLLRDRTEEDRRILTVAIHID